MRPVAHPTNTFAPTLRPSRRGLVAIAAAVAAATAGAVTIAVVDDEPTSPSRALSDPVPSSVRYDGGPNEGLALQVTRRPGPLEHRAGYSMAVPGKSSSQLARPDEGVAVRSIRVEPQLARPEEGVAVRSIGR